MRKKERWGFAVLTAVLVLLLPLAVLAQWGGLQKGLEAVRPAPAQGSKAPPVLDKPRNGAEEAASASGLAQDTTFQNAKRPFTYTIPKGWQQISGDPKGENAVFQRPGTTVSFNFHFTRMGPGFPRQSAVEQSYKRALEEKGMGKYLAVKRRDQGGVLGWETIETPDQCSGGIQRIQWQCYDQDNYYYSFMASSEPSQFPQYRAELQRIIDSVRFGR